MIDPKEFIGNSQEQPDEDTYMEISGTFMCEDCNNEVNDGLLSMESKHMMWKCECGHVTEGTL